MSGAPQQLRQAELHGLGPRAGGACHGAALAALVLAGRLRLRRRARLAAAATRPSRPGARGPRKGSRPAETKAAGEEEGESGAAGPKVKRKEVYPGHLRAQEIKKGLATGRFVEGELRMFRNTCFMGSVKVGKEEILVTGSRAMNRAINGDVVVVERLDSAQEEVYEGFAKSVRHGVGARTEAEDMEVALEEDLDMSGAGKGEVKGRVVGIVQRRARDIVGSIQPLDAADSEGPEMLIGRDRMFTPSDRRFPSMVVTVPPEVDAEDLDDKRVTVTMHMWDKFGEWPRGKWAKTLGKIGDREVETEMILMEHSISNEPFSEEVLSCLPPEDYVPTEATFRNDRFSFMSRPLRQHFWGLFCFSGLHSLTTNSAFSQSPELLGLSVTNGCVTSSPYIMCNIL